MPSDATNRDDLQGQAGSGGQTADQTEWKEKYVGLTGKMLDLQNKLTDAEARLQANSMQWAEEKSTILGESTGFKSALEAAQAQLGELTTKWTDASAQAESLTKQMERQSILLKHPGMISDPVMKLVNSSTMSAADLDEALAALSAGQKQLVDTSIADVRTGATPPVGGVAGTGASKQEQAQEAWQNAIAAMQKGDKVAYSTEYARYLALSDGSGNVALSAPAVLPSRPI